MWYVPTIPRFSIDQKLSTPFVVGFSDRLSRTFRGDKNINYVKGNRSRLSTPRFIFK